jgi:hypothetical protein
MVAENCMVILNHLHLRVSKTSSPEGTRNSSNEYTVNTVRRRNRLERLAAFFIIWKREQH